MGELISAILGVIAIGTAILVIAVLRSDKKTEGTNDDE